MDRLKLSRIDEDLDSSEVAALCFLCIDVINRKRLEGIEDAKGLFLRLEEKGLLENDVFLSQLLETIRRQDLLTLLETDSRPPETDATPLLSEYRVMLYKIYEDITKENFQQIKFLLLPSRRQMEISTSALDVFAEMEKSGRLSKTNVDELYTALLEVDQQLALTVQNYKQGITQQHQQRFAPHVSMDYQRINSAQPQQPFLSITETLPSSRDSVYSDAQRDTKPSPLTDKTEYYALIHKPRGLCVVINNEDFLGPGLKSRGGTQEDAKTLSTVFTRLGFTVVVHNNLTKAGIQREIKKLGKRNFLDDDALVVCVLSHGEKGCVFGTDEEPVFLNELTHPFRSGRVPTLAGKPKIFFIQACQGSRYQTGSLLPPPTQEEEEKQSHLEEDAGRVYVETVPSDADFLIGMATVPDCKSFRNTATGSIYIQELCRQLIKSAESPEMDDILTVLTRVNREVSRGEYLTYKQMPEPKYTFTKKLVLKFV